MRSGPGVPASATSSAAKAADAADAADVGRARSGWTGGQYGIVRVGLAMLVLGILVRRIDPGALLDSAMTFAAVGLEGLLVLGCLLSVPLALGWRDRIAAIALIPIVGGAAALMDGAPLTLPSPGIVTTTILLGLHACVPVAPFGARDAAGRVDPRGDWRRPSWVAHATWALLALAHVARQVAGVSPGPDAAGPLFETFGVSFATLATAALVFELALLTFGAPTATRAPAWLALVLWRIAWLAAFGASTGDASLFVVLAFACEPAWLAGRSLHVRAHARDRAREQGTAPDRRPAILYYDGDCGFCHRSVRFILSEELATPDALRLRFAPLASRTFATRVASRPDVDPAALPDSIVLDLEDGHLLTQSAAAIEIAARLGGVWRVLAEIGYRLPSRGLDRAYDGIAKIRKRLFAQPKDACPILPPELRARFDA